jgi:deoxyribodipyrimidine photo-lyase
VSTAIHWFRRDLRITDNTALAAAVKAYDHVAPVYIVSGWAGEHRWCGAPRQAFLCGCLESLAKNREAKGSRLIIRRGTADEALKKLAREIKADAIYFNRDPDPYGRTMEQRVARVARDLGMECHGFKDIALHEREEVLTGTDSPFKIFTPYAKAWLKLEKPAPGRALARISTPAGAASDALPTVRTWKLSNDATILEAGEAAARRRLGRFLDGPIFAYGQERDQPAQEGTSRLSQDLRHGTLSIREVYAKCAAVAGKGPMAHRRSAGIFINELIWREFYMQVLWHWPDVLDHEWQADYRDLKWRDHWRPEKRGGGERFARWCRGETGFPMVDAGMRQLLATGFMHNRVRMIVAMFLTKDLHVWWMHGESWFMRHLVDGEIASNNGGWQWSASTGTDAAPYFRIQNPWSQGKRFDPDGAYIQRWVAELRDVPAARLHGPPMPGAPLAKGYPLPMVDHAREREATLELFRGGRGAV